MTYKVCIDTKSITFDGTPTLTEMEAVAKTIFGADYMKVKITVTGGILDIVQFKSEQ